MHELIIRALSAMSGVITLSDSGRLQNFNENFIEALVGKEKKQQAMNSSMYITDIIPDFHRHIESCLENADDDDGDEQRHSEIMSSSLSPSLEGCFSSPTTSSTSVHSSFISPSTSTRDIADSFAFMNVNDDENIKIHPVESFITSNEHSPGDGCCGDPSTLPNKPENGEILNTESKKTIREGLYYGLAKHSDSSMIAVQYDVRRLQSGSHANWAVSIGYDRLNDFRLIQDSNNHHSRLSSLETSIADDDDDDLSLNQINIKQCDSLAGSIDNHTSLSIFNREHVGETEGEYSNHYKTYQLIGNGAFGSVKIAANRETGSLAVAKFICKSKVLPESWIAGPKHGGRMVPIELHFLETLSHPNIVKVLDVFENESFYQLVMEKLGCDMDLFEFIDHRPKMDEPLMSYIFRQVVGAVSYLHSKNIIHRDVKDENVIIDQNFHCKLIDFGSAAYFGRDILFSTFCGTMEYCSPEVLNGNKYRGPELEMWSLGVLLYTLVYLENPFQSPHETVNSRISLPWEVSDGLCEVIIWLLQKDPLFRATVSDVENHWWVTQPVAIHDYRFEDVLNNCDQAQLQLTSHTSQLQSSLKDSPPPSLFDSDDSSAVLESERFQRNQE
ncbi:hypothetical protein AB6A40_002272 [Gnathostoma spinigerum]|uniref:Protein kinase domain-containing protein n=1 Tax=Gnathostoma spinigerum TaxID=75299 RepID=A0ABD6E651_9BILA